MTSYGTLSSPPPRSPSYARYQVPQHIPSADTNGSSAMHVHGQGALSNLIKNQASQSADTRDARRGSFDRDEEQADVRIVRTSMDERRLSAVLNTPQMRSARLIGKSNPRYQWEQYWKPAEELKKMKKPIREYYERTNSLIQQYIYIDRLLDSSLPHDLLNEYEDANESPAGVNLPATIGEESEPGSPASNPDDARPYTNGSTNTSRKVKRTPRGIYRIANGTSGEESPLLDHEDDGPKPEIPGVEDDDVESGDRVVQIAIYVNLAANAILLAGKIVVIVLTSSLSVLASLVDAALDFLSTGIIWTTTHMISRQDIYQYPIGRRSLEPLGVLVFSVIMITSFFQVGLQSFNRLMSDDRSIIELTLPAILIMGSTVLIKLACWFWCRLVKNSSVQALAQDAMTDVVFNIFSIIFPLVGFYAQIWWLDGLGGLVLSLYVILNWAGTSASHIRNLTGAAATADERNVLLYLTMRFASTIKQIQGLQAYHAGDKLNVEVDIVLDESMSLRDSHDLGESLQYVLESVPTVDRAFVHQDYASWNLPSHMEQQA